MPENFSQQTAPTREMAEQVAHAMGCSGAHKVGDGWAPCESHEAMMLLIRKGKEGYDAWKQHQRRANVKPRRVIVQQALAAELGMRRRRFEPLTERGVRGIDTLPDGGLVSKSLKDVLREAIENPAQTEDF